MGQSMPLRRPIVLVVEDEPILRLLALDLVERAGFEAIEAADADEAILILGSREDIAIVFTDIQMPGSMDGMKLANAIRDRWPPIKIILTSGHCREDELNLGPGHLFFAKPYDPVRVGQALVNMAG